MGYFMLGGSLIDLEALNSSPENKGYAKLSDNFLTIGGGGHRDINRILLGGEGHGLRGKETASGGSKNSMHGGYGFFDLGYLLYASPALRVYPLVGLGGGAITLKMVAQGTAPLV